MGLVEESLYIFRQLLSLFNGGWQRLDEHNVSEWALKRAKGMYRKMHRPIGKRRHFIGKYFFYRVWFRGNKDWVFYRKRK